MFLYFPWLGKRKCYLKNLARKRMPKVWAESRYVNNNGFKLRSKCLINMLMKSVLTIAAALKVAVEA